MTGLREPEQVRSVFVTDGVLQALAVPPQAGRWLSAQDQGVSAPPTVMLAYGYWQRRFGGEADTVGRIITIDNTPRQVVGVMPRGFRVGDIDTDIIVPVRFDRSQLIRPGFGFVGVARLKPGVTIAAANADLGRMLPIWLHGWPGGTTAFYESMQITPALRPLKDDVVGGTGDALWLVMGTIAIVLLIACANVTNLLLVRAEGRQQEMAIRAALGASSGRLVRERLIESVMLSLIGGLFGLAIAYASFRILVAIGPTGLPRLQEISLDARALLFTLVVSILAGILLGLAPALRFPGRRIASGLQSATRGGGTSRQRHRAQNALVVGQVALAVVLLVGAGLMIRTFAALRSVDPGFSGPEQLQIMRIVIASALVPEAEAVQRLQHDMLDRMSAIPGATSAAMISSMPMQGIPGNWDIISVPGQPRSPAKRRFGASSTSRPDSFALPARGCSPAET